MGCSTIDTKVDKITIEYQLNENQNEVTIFNEIFVNNNKEKCKIEVEGQEYELVQNLNVENFKKENNILKIQLKGINNITNMESMFSGCTNLSSLPDISRWDTINVTNMSSVFSQCENLTTLPDISK